MKNKTPALIPLPGVYVPLLSWTKPNSDALDLDAYCKQIDRVVAEGVQGILVHAGRGDPTDLPVPEYKAAIQAAKDTICASAKPGPISRTSYPTLVVGTSASTLFRTIERCVYAHQLGADYVLVHAPADATTEHQIASFFTRVAKWSKIPVILYETAGTPAISSALLHTLAAHGNIVGLVSWRPSTGGKHITGFATFQCTSSLHMSLGGSTGIIAPLANLIPAAVVRAWTSWASGNVAAARRFANDMENAGVLEAAEDVPGIAVRACGRRCPECPFWPCEEAGSWWGLQNTYYDFTPTQSCIDLAELATTSPTPTPTVIASANLSFD
ncbi:aldolase [Cutaneotrichosporon oleaginosum]|uniref:Aldolase n=1 Tax=Cutaneotrichosporon oleaginosum TaxID=879819 RepID=A0A0J0XMF7_9TREE|nr:aldolase [Cutaneotrichosporon oleaginosum]KLT42325.1 aldolase [Cutaneotrichosporon oleaginosum]TXT04145.1 hypothetical protein COLE_07842 [Cutaneotrichosporon oleaginosum]